MSELSDESLLAGLGSGNSDAAAAFVRRFQSRVYGLALAMLRDPALADEVAQETFVRAWRHAATYDACRGRVATWVLAIARNLAIDLARVKPVVPTAPEVLASSLELEVPERDAVPDVGERERVRIAVATLPDDQQRALVLSVYAGKTAREISELERVPVGTVKTRIRTAMIKLRPLLEVERGL
jgi:RNA polymerase sigma-70 factor (ECF subfamily)